jgi:RHS repeat-associated protein
LTFTSLIRSRRVRQKFTLKERDNETGLDYFLARYYSSTQGRFTSADPLLASAERSDPQTWNRYTYVTNNPLGFTDPTGERRNPVTGRRGINPVPANGTLGGVRSNRGNPHVGEWGMTRSGGTQAHWGTDITAPIGTDLVAMESGTVIAVRPNDVGDGGRQVHVRMPDGTIYKYFHLSAIPQGIAAGVAVQEGQVIAVSGNSGNAGGLTATNEDHVHTSVIGPNGNSINPVTWLNDPNAGVPVDVVTTTGTPPATPITVPAGSANEQIITGPTGTVTVRQQPLPVGQPHIHRPPR